MFVHIHRGLAVASLLAGSIAPQASLSFANGVLGEEVHFHVAGGDPFQFLGLAPSLQAAHTPLAIIDPGDPRRLDVGVDLIHLWEIGLLDAQGAGSISYALPADPGLSGITLYAQAVTGLGTTTLVDDITERAEYTLALQGESVYTLGAPMRARRHHGGTALLDGSIVLSGGMDAATIGLPVPVVFGDAEVLNPLNSQFDAVFPLVQARALHTATLLSDGRLLLLGGVGASGNVLASGEIYDPQLGLSTPIPPMAGPRVLHTATLLDDGRVLVVGGSADYTTSHPLGHPASFLQPALAATEIFEPTPGTGTGTWSTGPMLAAARTAHDAQLLLDGTVLISGGVLFLGQPVTTPSCLLIDPIAGTTPPTASLPGPRAFHDGVPVHDGRVLVAGGADVNLAQPSAVGILSTALYTAATRAPAFWTGGASLPSIVIGPDTRCICKKIVVITGADGANPPCLPDDIFYAVAGGVGATDVPGGTAMPQDACFVADSSLSAWSVSNTGLESRPDSTTTVTNDGARLLSSGAALTGAPTAELWMLDG